MTRERGAVHTVQYQDSNDKQNIPDPQCLRRAEYASERFGESYSRRQVATVPESVMGARSAACCSRPPSPTTTSDSLRSTTPDIPTRIPQSRPFANYRQDMTAIGSVFLGDVQRHRILSTSTSTSTPPSSPPPHLTMSPSALNQFFDLSNSTQDLPREAPGPPPSVSPEVSLDLRIRWLETILFGAKQDTKDKQKALGNLRTHDSLVRGVEDIRRRLDTVVQSSEGLRRFMSHCEFLFNLTFAPPPIKYNLRRATFSSTHPLICIVGTNTNISSSI